MEGRTQRAGSRVSLVRTLLARKLQFPALRYGWWWRETEQLSTGAVRGVIWTSSLAKAPSSKHCRAGKDQAVFFLIHVQGRWWWQDRSRHTWDAEHGQQTRAEL